MTTTAKPETENLITIIKPILLFSSRVGQLQTRQVTLHFQEKTTRYQSLLDLGQPICSMFPVTDYSTDKQNCRKDRENFNVHSGSLALMEAGRVSHIDLP